LPVAEAQINAIKTGSKINVTIDGKFFTSYIFSEDEKYPFFYPVNGPVSGGSVTSMRNAVYPHHSSLFFGCDQVNGGNYWQEGLERGRIVSVNAQSNVIVFLRIPGSFIPVSSFGWHPPTVNSNNPGFITLLFCSSITENASGETEKVTVLASPGCK